MNWNQSDLKTCECGRTYNITVAPRGHGCPECWVRSEYNK